MIKTRFVVVNRHNGDPIFNYPNQTYFFPTIKAAEKGIRSLLDKSVGESWADYQIFECVKP